MTTTPWPDAPIEDRLRMFCGEHQYGVDRERIGRMLGGRGRDIDRALAYLVEHDWLRVDHPTGVRGRESVYELDRHRPGLSALARFWGIEYGYSLPDFTALSARQDAPREDPQREALIAATMVQHSGRDETPHPRVYRQARADMLEQYGRGNEMWSRLQEMHSTEHRERARDLIHLEPIHATPVPSAEPGPDGAAALLRLAAACRQAAREDAEKWRWLAESANAGLGRVLALSEAAARSRNALAPLAGPHAHSGDDSLRHALTAATASAMLSDRVQYARDEEVGWAGDVMVAYTLRDMARRLEAIAQRLTSMPEISEAALTPAGRELLGEEPDLTVPAPLWSRIKAEPRRERTPLDEPEGDVIASTATELRAGDQIVALGTRPLVVAVDVLSDPTDLSVDLGVSGGWQRFVVPMDLLGDAELGVRTRHARERSQA